MPQALIRLAFRHIIDSSSLKRFERNIFEDTYSEFQLQSQAYNPNRKYRTFTQIAVNDPEAGSLHYKVGKAVNYYVNGLKSIVPDLKDSLGRPVSFAKHRFELIDSDIITKASHRVAIVYETDTLTLFAQAGEYLVLSVGDRLNLISSQPTQTFVLKMQPNLSIISWQERNFHEGLFRQTQSN